MSQKARTRISRRTCEGPKCELTISNEGDGHFRWGCSCRVKENYNGRPRLVDGSQARIYVCSRFCYNDRLEQLERVAARGSTNEAFQTVDSFIEMWVEKEAPFRKDGDLVDNSAMKTKISKARFWADEFRGIKWSALRLEDVLTPLNRLRHQENKSAGTMNTYRKHLRAILKSASVKHRLLSRDVFDDWFGDEQLVPRYHDDGKELDTQKSFDVKARAALQNFDKSKMNTFHAYIAANLALETSARLGEAMGFMWSDFDDLDYPKKVKIVRQLDGENRLKLPKGRKKRAAHIRNPERVASLLREALAYQKAQELAHDPITPWQVPEFDGVSGLVLVRNDGSTLSQKSTRNSFSDELTRLNVFWRRRVGTKNGTAVYGKRIPEFHKLRYTYVTDMQLLGVPEAMVQDSAGHSDVQQTREYTDVNRPLPPDHYAKVMENDRGLATG